MIKKLLLIIFVFKLLFLNSQTSVYKPFPTTYGNWVYMYYNDTHHPTGLQKQYTLSNDTIISSFTYKKVYIDFEYRGALREDSKIIYFIPDTSSIEYVLYDFNLTVGSLINNPFGGSVCTNGVFTVTSIDSVLASDGYHKRFSFDQMAPKWIEGIGSTEYLLEPLQTFCVSGNDELQCVVNSTVFHYPTWLSTCVTSFDKQIITSSNVKIFPNPFNDSFTVDINNAEIKEIIVTNVLGETVFREQTGSQTKIHIRNLQSGAYFVTAIGKNDHQTQYKILSCK